MNARRLPQQPTKTPALTRGEERPETPCDGRWDVYDAVIDSPTGVNAHEAAPFCRACPLAATCLTRTDDRHWAEAAQAILRELALPLHRHYAKGVA